MRLFYAIKPNEPAPWSSRKILHFKYEIDCIRRRRLRHFWWIVRTLLARTHVILMRLPRWKTWGGWWSLSASVQLHPKILLLFLSSWIKADAGRQQFPLKWQAAFSTQHGLLKRFKCSSHSFQLWYFAHNFFADCSMSESSTKSLLQNFFANHVEGI